MEHINFGLDNHTARKFDFNRNTPNSILVLYQIRPRKVFGELTSNVLSDSRKHVSFVPTSVQSHIYALSSGKARCVYRLENFSDNVANSRLF
ncbi:hypothetical protein T5B8_07108 [Salinisphaera sp. T5B8]